MGKYFLSRGNSSIFDSLLEIFRFLGIVLIIWAWLSTCAEVFLRYFLNRPQGWTLELTEYSLLYITFLGAPWLLRRDGHVKMDIVIRKLSIKTQNIVNTISSLLCLIVCLVVAWGAGMATWTHFQRDSVTPKLLEFPLYPLLAIIMMGYGFLAIQFLRRATGFIKELRN
jgi:C4-dicarboxylate transporter DctQ subunit